MRFESTFSHFAPGKLLQTYIRRQLSRLESSSHQLIHCQVTLEASARHEPRLFYARIAARTVKAEIVVSETDENEYVAVRNAFDTLRRSLYRVHYRTRRCIAPGCALRDPRGTALRRASSSSDPGLQTP